MWRNTVTYLRTGPLNLYNPGVLVLVELHCTRLDNVYGSGLK